MKASELYRDFRVASIRIIGILLVLLAACGGSAFGQVMIRDHYPYALVQEPAAQAGAVMYAGTSLPYTAPWTLESPADSLEVIFVDHVGRHGARFLSKEKDTAKMLEYLHGLKVLTPFGRNMEWLCERLDSVTAGRWGALDSIGFNEQDSIGKRMVVRAGGLFGKGDSLQAIASYVPRCVMSMDVMTHAMLWQSPKMSLASNSGPQYDKLLRFFDTDSAYRIYIDRGEWEKVWHDYVCRTAPRAPALRLGEGRTAISKRDAQEISMMMYKIVSGAMCILPDMDWRPFFAEREYRELWQCSNLKHYLCYSANGLSEEPAAMARGLLTDIISTLEAATRPGYDGPKAILRFGHAETMMPLLSLIGIPGCRYVTDDWDSVADNWQDCSVAPMAANLQLYLCRSKKSGKKYLMVYHNESQAMPIMDLENGLIWLRKGLETKE